MFVRSSRQSVFLVMLAVFTIQISVAASSPSAEEMADDLATLGLPQDRGREEVEIYCSACHSLRLVAQQGLTRSAWEDTIKWMVDEQEMDPINPEDHVLVLDYLAKHLNVDARRKSRNN